MVIEVVAILVEMLVKHKATWASDVISAGVKPLVCGGFGFPYILVFTAFDAVTKINAVPALAVESVSDLEDLSSLLAFEVLRRCYLAAAFGGSTYVYTLFFSNFVSLKFSLHSFFAHLIFAPLGAKPLI